MALVSLGRDKLVYPTLIGIALLFGIGNAFDSIVSGVAYAYYLKKNRIRILQTNE